ncbi:(Fe-S)-binding protein [Nitratidesulfovibrio termitidis]|uniref:(Fe-S)-binding protein n=1 Tax=Nitratidesulfovibrio termitidis TaxID=42252 RepID=UPI00041BDDDE|nr:(Fe-S)-binding protein [Nitratidesulfovibrio termitidis]
MSTDTTSKSTTNGSTADDTAGQPRACLLCGQCTAVCPAFLTTGQEELSPRAKHLVFAALRDEPGRLGLKPARELADRCLSCGRCAAICPQGLSVPHALAALRARHPNWQQWLWKQWIEHGRLLWPALAQMTRVVPGAVVPEGVQHMLRSAAAMLPPPPPAPWIVADRATSDSLCDGDGPDGMRNHTADSATRGEATRAPAMLFSGCTARRIRPRWKDTARALLRWLGHPAPAQGDEESFTCCGSTLEHAGIPDAAASARARNLDAWRAAGRPLLVTFCATCHHGLSEYPDHADLDWQDGEREAWTEALRPLSTLWGDAGFRVTADAPAQPGADSPAPVRYHQPCHRKGTDPDAVWLRSLLGDRMRAPGGVNCCGMGGVLQLAAPDLSRTVASSCWNALLPERAAASDTTPAAPSASASGSDTTSATASGTIAATPDASQAPDITVLTGCSGCTLQLAATAPAGVRVLHWLDVVGVPRT